MGDVDQSWAGSGGVDRPTIHDRTQFLLVFGRHSAIELIGRFEAEQFEGAENGGACGSAKLALKLGSKHDGALLSAEGGLRRRAVVQGGSTGFDDGIPLTLRAEVLLPGFAGEIATMGAGVPFGFEKSGNFANVLFGDLKEKALPVHVRRQEVVIGDEDGCDAGAHNFKEPDAACSGSARAENEVRGGEDFGVTALAVDTAGLCEIPVVVGGCVFNEDVGAVPMDVEEALAEERCAASLKGEKELPGGCGHCGGDEGIAVLAVA